MASEECKPGLSFRFDGVAEDVFFFAFPCTILKGDGLYRRLNLQGAFIEHEWYRFPDSSRFLERAKEFDFVG
jgi:hypothetical protein